MYKYFALIFYAAPFIVFYASQKSRDNIFSTHFLLFFFIFAFFYILFPIFIFVRAMMQFKKDTSLSKGIEKINSVTTRFNFRPDILSASLKIYLLAACFIFAFFTAAFLFTRMIWRGYGTELSTVLGTITNPSDYTNKVTGIDRKIENLEQKFYQERSKEFYENNLYDYRYKGSVAEFDLANEKVDREVAGFDSVYGYKFRFCFDEKYLEQINSEDYRLAACPGIVDVYGNFGAGNVSIFQDEIIKDFYVDTHYIGENKFPVFIGTVKTATRNISFISYLKNIDTPSELYNYVFHELNSTELESFSDECALHETTVNSIKFKCISTHPSNPEPAYGKFQEPGIEENILYITIELSETGEFSLLSEFEKQAE